MGLGVFPPAPPLHEEVAEGEREGGVETAEVTFVPMDNDFGVFSGADTDYDDVVVEDEGDVVVEAEGDVLREVVLNEGDVAGVEKLEDEENDVAWDGGDKWMMDRVSEDLEKNGEGDEENFLWNQRLAVARF